MGGLIGVDPAVLALSAGIENAGAASMAAATAASAPMCTVVPPGTDAPSAAAAGGLNARGAATQAMMSELVAMRALFGDTVAVNGVSYAAVDAVSQATMMV